MPTFTTAHPSLGFLDLHTDLKNLSPPLMALYWSTLNHLVDTAVMGQIMPTTLLLAHPDLKNLTTYLHV